MKSYDIQVTATIQIGGQFTVLDQDNQDAAVAAAIQELRTNGEVFDINVERCIYLDPNPDV